MCNNAFTDVKRTRFKACKQLEVQRLLFSWDTEVETKFATLPTHLIFSPFCVFLKICICNPCKDLSFAYVCPKNMNVF